MDKKIFVTRSSMPSQEEYMKEIEDLWNSHWLTNMGAHHEKLKKELKDYLQIPEIALVSSGHMALETAIQALELTGEVITTPFTFVSTTHALVRNGIQPVYCDIREDDYTIDADKMESLITDKTTAILPVHVYGNVCQVEKIEEIAKKYELKVIYDASHAFGVKYKGKALAGYGDVATFSFHATKIFHTVEGGAVCSHDSSLNEKIHRIKNFGILDEEHVQEIGMNAKMNELQAAMGSCNLRHIEQEISQRRNIYLEYRKCLEPCVGIRLNRKREDVETNCAYFPIIVEDEFPMDRDSLYDHLKANGIYARKYFYPLIPKMDCYQKIYKNINLPVAENIARRVLTLPLFGEMSLEDVHRICDIIMKCYK